jgi:spore germination cell wall hydrolase CwlJ-like protein
MRIEFPVRAGALGGLAAGLMLLGASTALAREPAAMTGPGLKIIPSDDTTSGLRAVTEAGESNPLQAAPVVSLASLPSSVTALTGSAAVWNPASNDPLTCLAQAIYFEARSEGEDGQEAVAQVVMNRTHMPQYADTVCGVVYQGAERATGCQFTFACDGSLREPDDPIAWDRAKDVARRALGGFVYTPMLAATHYHAAWMTPYWSGSLTRIRRIGGQVFYH